MPLLCFGAAARRLKMTTLGFLQYLAPTIQLMLAVLLFGEAFTPIRIAGFGCAWVAVAIYTTDSLILLRKQHRQVEEFAAEPAAEPS
jgi:chloramphenicol-sensitive protein RarD